MISIIIVNYNKSKFIKDTLHSVHEQTFKNWECIIIDDCSSDNSISIITNFIKKDSRYKLIENSKNLGASNSRNIGYESAKFDYVIFLDSDDVLTVDCLINRKEVFVENELIDFAVFPMGTFIKKKGDSKYVWNNFQGNTLDRFLSHDLPWALPSVLWRKSFLKKLNGFNGKFRRLQDVELHTRAIVESGGNYKIFDFSDPDCYYRIDDKRSVFKNHIESKCDGVISYIDFFVGYLKEKNVKHKRKFLRKTYFKFYSELIFYYKCNKLSNDEFMMFVIKLSECLEKCKLNNLKTRILICSYTNIKTWFNFKGLNYFFYKII